MKNAIIIGGSPGIDDRPTTVLRRGLMKAAAN